MTFLRFVFQSVVAVVFASVSLLPMAPAISAMPERFHLPTSLIIFLLASLVIASAPTVRRAFGRSFCVLGAAVFVLPISTILLSGSIVAAEEDAVGATAGLLAGGTIAFLSGILSWWVGGLLLFIGLILSLGGRREVVVVSSEPN